MNLFIQYCDVFYSSILSGHLKLELFTVVVIKCISVYLYMCMNYDTLKIICIANKA